MKTLPVMSIILAGSVAIAELRWLQITSLAWVILALAVAVLLTGIYLAGERR
jgi:hypothetical protein